ncbi:MAG TPA: hypothetical protein DCS93_01795 [Microscillaceae bacterium]|nr:hypothetical protein [Microscillaceae bacterium]
MVKSFFIELVVSDDKNSNKKRQRPPLFMEYSFACKRLSYPMILIFLGGFTSNISKPKARS